jgi:hypothetical protein
LTARAARSAGAANAGGTPLARRTA